MQDYKNQLENVTSLKHEKSNLQQKMRYIERNSKSIVKKLSSMVKASKSLQREMQENKRSEIVVEEVKSFFFEANIIIPNGDTPEAAIQRCS